MAAFILPDLGEGLKDAELVEWLVKEGQSVKLDELILLVETAKAVVEIPAPAAGVITRLAVTEGETVQVGQVLFEYDETTTEGKRQENKTYKKEAKSKTIQKESVSVVGELSKAKDEKTNLYEIEQCVEIGSAIPSTFSGTQVSKPDNGQKKISTVEPVCFNTFKETRDQNTKAEKQNVYSTLTPKTMAFAKKLGLQEILNETNYGEITLHELFSVYQNKVSHEKQKSSLEETIALSGTRKAMASVMTKSHQEIPAATLFEDADVSKWCSNTDMTLAVIKAITVACSAVPILNAWFDSENKCIQPFKDVNLGLAVNSGRGLFVPVIRKINTQKDSQIRATINRYRTQIEEQTIQAQDLVGASISLSNFGSMSGRYATPIIVPPQVCIVGVGKAREEVLVKHGKIQIGKILPISISFDHRVATGADAARFMQRMIEVLEE